MPTRHPHPRAHLHRTLPLLLPTLTTALTTLTPPATAATSYTWSNPAGGTWSDPTNWSPSSAAPTTGDSATFNLGPSDPVAFASYPGYTVTLPADLQLASGFAHGTLTLRNDKLTLAGGHALTAYTLLAAATAGQHASLSLTGGSSLTLAGFGDNVGYGAGSVASLDLSAGSSLTTPTLGIGIHNGTAHVTVDGPGSALHAKSITNGGGGHLYIGSPGPGSTDIGTATLTVTRGASVETDTGFDLGAGSSITLTGPGSSLTDHGDSTIVGHISASAGASITSHSSFGLWTGSTLTLSASSANLFSTYNYGTIQLSDGASLTTTANTAFPNYGTISGSGALNTGLFLYPSSTLALSLTSPSSYDRLTGISSLSFGGTLSLTADPSYTPHPGDSFDLLDFTSRSFTSTFSTLSLPSLPAGLSWNTSALYTTGTLSVLPEPTTCSLLLTLPTLTLLPRRRRA